MTQDDRKSTSCRFPFTHYYLWRRWECADLLRIIIIGIKFLKQGQDIGKEGCRVKTGCRVTRRHCRSIKFLAQKIKRKELIELVIGKSRNISHLPKVNETTNKLEEINTKKDDGFRVRLSCLVRKEIEIAEPFLFSKCFSMLPF